jgi:hypothetical protein
VHLRLQELDRIVKASEARMGADSVRTVGQLIIYYYQLRASGYKIHVAYYH